ncbi:hypothetical protein AMAG_13103 [Allomyces macrogynus ATCC 38327]|nr:hypothetical protein AMAG_13103 [Allomyces macrogynus ATCC 38327]|eukprot:KNE68451.1 hypothetical protein AMAG_13103 [Allomyces macrogynus ATCC 38327]
MTYDFHGAWDGITNHQAHFYDKTPGATGPQYEITSALQRVLDAGCAPSKIIMGVPFYGRVETGVSPGPDANKPGLYQPHTGASGKEGVMPYRQIVTDDSFKSFWDNDAKASFAYSASKKLFASYDTTQAVNLKIDYINQKQLGGGMFWLMGQDDVNNTLLNTLSVGLRKGQKANLLPSSFLPATILSSKNVTVSSVTATQRANTTVISSASTTSAAARNVTMGAATKMPASTTLLAPATTSAASTSTRRTPGLTIARPAASV